MKMYIERYKAWVNKMTVNLEKSKGAEGHLLRSRFQCLELREDLIGCLYHSTTLHSLIEEFGLERHNLRWVERLQVDCERWHHLFECSVRLSKLERDVIIQALVESNIDVEFAINLS